MKLHVVAGTRYYNCKKTVKFKFHKNVHTYFIFLRKNSILINVILAQYTNGLIEKIF